MSNQQTEQQLVGYTPQSQQDPYHGLTPSVLEYPDVNQFDNYFQAAARPEFKRAPSSADSLQQMRPEQKRHRQVLLHMDSDRSSSANTAISTETSNHSSGGSNQPSPPSDDAAVVTPIQQGSINLNERTSLNAYVQTLTRPVTARGSNLSPHALPLATQGSIVVAPARFEDMIRNYAQARQGTVQARPKALPEQFGTTTETGVETRRSKANAMQHIGQVAEEEEDDSQDDESANELPIRATAKRSGKKKVVKAAVPKKVEEPLDDDEDKRAQFLERNRLAACKSRQKKKEWIKSLESQSDDLTRQNGDLQILVAALREEITLLRSTLAAHTNCTAHPMEVVTPSQHLQRMPEQPQAVILPQSPPADSTAFHGNGRSQHHPHLQSHASQAHGQSWPSLSSSLPSTRPISPTATYNFASQSIIHSPDVIDFNGQSGLTPLINSHHHHPTNYGEQDYFSTMVDPHRVAFSTPDLAKSLGFSN